MKKVYIIISVINIILFLIISIYTIIDIINNKDNNHIIKINVDEIVQKNSV